MHLDIENDNNAVNTSISRKIYTSDDAISQQSAYNEELVDEVPSTDTSVTNEVSEK